MKHIRQSLTLPDHSPPLPEPAMPTPSAATTSTTPPHATKAFRILAADKLADDGLAFIEAQADAELINKPGLSEAEYAALLASGEVDAMIVRSGVTVTPAMLASPGHLRIIARAGVGVDNIDLPSATAAGIVVANTAEASTITTAEHAFALLMGLLRNLGPASRTMYEGGWDRSKYQGRQLQGMTLGVVGFGRIGQTVAERALAFGMKVVAFDPVWSSATAMDGQVKMFTNFEAMLPHAEALSFHVPLNDHTRGMLNTQTFEVCREGVFVVNASRGGVVDETDLIKALDEGRCGGAALDVFVEEPLAADSPLRTHPKVLCTPHLGASTKEAQQAVSIEAAKACLAYLRGEGISGAVNAGGLRVDLDPLQSAFVDLAGRMATLLGPMITRGIARVEVCVEGEAIGAAANTIERAALVGLLGGYLSEPVNLINVEDVARRRGIKTTCSTSDAAATRGPRLTLEVFGGQGAVDAATADADRSRKIAGHVYEDLQPRLAEINGYAMDMIPEGTMVLIQNDDQPGIIGQVGTTFGQAGVNIADMTISRRTDSAGTTTALMLLKVDQRPGQDLLKALLDQPGIRKAADVTLPPRAAGV